MRLIPSHLVKLSGKLYLMEKNYYENRKRNANIRGKDITMIFQDPMTSLNPTMTIGNKLWKC